MLRFCFFFYICSVACFSMGIYFAYFFVYSGRISSTGLEQYFSKNEFVKVLGYQWSAVKYFLFYEGRDGVIIGRNGWLYSSEELGEVIDYERELNSSLHRIERIRQHLAERDVELILLLLPAKARIYSEHLRKVDFPRGFDSRYDEIKASLSERSISVADIRSDMMINKNPLLFHRMDTHWTDRGAKIAAKYISKMSQLDSYIKNPSMRLNMSVVDCENFDSDLYAFVDIGYYKKFSEMKSDCFNVYKIDNNIVEIKTAMSDEELFGVNTVDIVLVGTSYSADSRWYFKSLLSEALNYDVVNYAEKGRGAILPMEKYIYSDDFYVDDPKIIIWEFPERYFWFDIENGSEYDE